MSEFRERGPVTKSDRRVMETPPASPASRRPAREVLDREVRGPADSTHADDPLVQALSHRIDEVVRPLVPADRPVALLDFPHYPNVGDSAIWLGANAVLERLNLPRPCYVCSVSSYSPQSLARVIGNGTILLSGGGNFGDLYKSHQDVREEVITAFPNNRIVQLPQSIYFRSRDNLERARAIVNEHPDFTLLVRDHRSLDTAKEEFRASVALCPDLAFALAPLGRKKVARSGVVWLGRSDHESLREDPRQSPATRAIPGSASVNRVDWLGDRPTLLLELNRQLTRRIEYQRRYFGWLEPVLARTFAPAARQRFDRGCRMLEVADRVITDRLHGHILCLLLGIPHALLDNTNGKVRALYETWTSGSALTRWCDSEAEALATVEGDR